MAYHLPSDRRKHVEFTEDEISEILTAIKGAPNASISDLGKITTLLNKRPSYHDLLVTDMAPSSRPALYKLYRLLRAQLPSVIEELHEWKWRIPNWEQEDWLVGEIVQWENLLANARKYVKDAKPALVWHRLAAFAAGVYFQLDGSAGFTRNGPAVAFVEAVLARITGKTIGKSAIEEAVRGVQLTGCGQLLGKCLLAPRSCAWHHPLAERRNDLFNSKKSG